MLSLKLFEDMTLWSKTKYVLTVLMAMFVAIVGACALGVLIEALMALTSGAFSTFYFTAFWIVMFLWAVLVLRLLVNSADKG